MKEDISNHKFILFVGDHFNPLGMIRSLGEYGIYSDVVLISRNPILVNHSRYINCIKIFVTPNDGIEYIISTYSNEKFKPFILTGSDDLISVIDSNFSRLKDLFIFFTTDKQNGINELLSKRKQNELALSCGFNVPAFEEVKVGDKPTLVKYPLITKSIDSTVYNWKNQVFLCKDYEELLNAYKKLKCGKILLQEYVEKENETGFDALSINHGKDVYLPLQLTYHSVLETNFGHSIFFFKPKDEELIYKVRKLIQKTKFDGIFSIDFLKGKDGNIYFLEINFRNSAWSYPMTRAGVNLPIIWAKSTLSKCLDLSNVNIKKLPFSAIVETSEFIQGFRKGLKTGVRAIKNICKSDSLIMWSFRDPKPFLYFVYSHFNKK